MLLRQPTEGSYQSPASITVVCRTLHKITLRDVSLVGDTPHTIAEIAFATLNPFQTTNVAVNDSTCVVLRVQFNHRDSSLMFYTHNSLHRCDMQRSDFLKAEAANWEVDVSHAARRGRLKQTERIFAHFRTFSRFQGVMSANCSPAYLQLCCSRQGVVCCLPFALRRSGQTPVLFGHRKEKICRRGRGQGK